MSAIAELVDRHTDMLFRRREAADARNNAIDARAAELVADALASAPALAQAFSDYLIYDLDDKLVHVEGPMTSLGRGRSMTALLAQFTLLDMIRDGAPIERMRAYEQAIRKTIEKMLLNDPGVLAEAEQLLEEEAAEVASWERRR